jgi:hypothetical protein
VIQEEFVVAVEMLAEPRSVTDPYREPVDRVTVVVRGKVDAPFVVRPVSAAPVVVDPVRDVEAMVFARAIVPVGAMVVPVELFVLLVLALMSVLDPVSLWVPAAMSLGGCGEGQSEQERCGGKGDLGDTSHGKTSFSAPVYCQNRANTPSWSATNVLSCLK